MKFQYTFLLLTLLLLGTFLTFDKFGIYFKGTKLQFTSMLDFKHKNMQKKIKNTKIQKL